jgi:hypothetical protein
MDTKSQKIMYWAIFGLGLVGLFFYGILINSALLDESIEIMDYWFLACVSLILILSPVTSRIRIGKIFDIEKDIQNTKEELRDFRQEFRQNIQLISTITANMNANVTVNGIPFRELEKKADALEASTEGIEQGRLDDIENEITAIGDENAEKLFRIRYHIESQLRKILGKEGRFQDGKRYFSAGRLATIFFEKYPQYREIESSLRFVLDICNRAVHTERIPEGYVEEVTFMGARIIAFLEDVPINAE